MPEIFSEPLFWAVLAGAILLVLLAVAAVRLARVEERARAGERHLKEAQALKSDLDRLAREQEGRVAALSAAEARAAALAENVERIAAEAGALRAERDALARTLAALEAEARGFERQIADLKQAKEEMRNAFVASADTLMKSHSEALKNENKSQLDALLAPLKNDIAQFKQSLGEAHLKSSEQHGALKEQIRHLAEQSAAVARDAQNLTRALKSDVQLQGAWGEMVLESLLQRLGFREGEEYSRQESHTDESGRVRTDYVLNLPQGDRLIIDSKVSLLDFEAHVNAATEDERAARLAAHVRSMRNHVRGLAGKRYDEKVGTRIDFVIMFVPIEAALGAALGADKLLSVDALDQKVAIATPTTLTTTLQIVAAAWKVERQNRHAENIARRAGLLYEKFAGFVADLEVVGDRLRKAQSSYDDAFSKLKTGSGNLIKQAETLKAMGAKTSKALPARLLDEAGATNQEGLLALVRGDDPGDVAAAE